MIIEEDDLEKLQLEVVEGLRDKIRKRLELFKKYVIKYVREKTEVRLLLASILDKVSAGSLVVALLPDEFGWRPIYALALFVFCFVFALKFKVDSKNRE